MDVLLGPEYRQHILLALILGVAVLLLIALAFAVSVVLLRLETDRKAEMWDRLQHRWEEAILGVLTGDRTPAMFRSLVAPHEELYCVNYVMGYLRRMVGAERALLREVVRPYLERVVARTKAHDPQRRARAVQTLGEVGLDQHAAAVTAALDDPSPLVAMVAARSLARAEHPQYLGPVLEHLHRFTDWNPNFLASMLAAVGPEAGPPLRAILADVTRPPQVRTVVATALAYLNDLSAADIAAAVIDDAHTDRELVAACLRLLARVGRHEHVPLVRRLVDAGDFVVRAAAASALGSLGAGEDLAVLRSVCEDESRWVALHAARALRDAGDVETLQHLASSGRARATLAMQVLTEIEP